MKLTKCSYNHPAAKKTNTFEILIESKENEFYLEITYPPLSSSNSPSSPFVFILSAFPSAMLSKNKLEILKELKKGGEEQ